MKYSTDLPEHCRGILFGRHLCQLAVVGIVSFVCSGTEFPVRRRHSLVYPAVRRYNGYARSVQEKE
jgi:hypothetical protein